MEDDTKKLMEMDAPSQKTVTSGALWWESLRQLKKDTEAIEVPMREVKEIE